MFKGRVSLIASLVLAALVLTLTGCGRNTIMRINGEKVNKSDFYGRLEAVPVQTQQGPQPAGRYIMEQIVKEKLIQQLAKKQGVEPTEEQLNTKLDFLKKTSGGNFERTLRMSGRTIQQWKVQQKIEQSLINVVTKGVSIDESDAQKAYQAALKNPQSGLSRPEQTLISAIEVKAKVKIDKAYKLLTDGQDFGAVATRISENPGASRTQGVLDWVSKNDPRVPKLVSQMAFTLEPGKYSKPFQVNDEWAIIRADQRRDAKTLTYDDVKSVIIENMKMQKGLADGNLAKAWTDFTKSSDIEIKLAQYKDIPEALKKDAANQLELQLKAMNGQGKAPKPAQPSSGSSATPTAPTMP